MADTNDPDLVWGGDTKSRIYHHLHLGMLKLFEDGQYDQAEPLAEGYLRQDDLPIHFRCHCHLIFACRANAWALGHAERAVELLDKYREEGGERFPHQLYAQAQSILAEAKAEREEDVDLGNARDAAHAGLEPGEGEEELELEEAGQLMPDVDPSNGLTAVAQPEQPQAAGDGGVSAATGVLSPKSQGEDSPLTPLQETPSPPR